MVVQGCCRQRSRQDACGRQRFGVATLLLQAKHYYTSGRGGVGDPRHQRDPGLDQRPRRAIPGAGCRCIDRLAEAGPSLGRPLVDKLEGSQAHNLKELRPGSAGRSEVRILFAFDPWRSAILLIGGDKSGDWSGWYRWAIPHAEGLCAKYLT
ncbi:type II toxin-antitoxin system RelE/ParE family toxin [Nonomuraea montanisoli]|uniref:type II toxin-antitoxin system RelE/ParE family toxin n=1 Tax=Nonomuraea montanisoli TaxID=2741721 RepID=UPI001962A6AC|nr:type II toxin-antitoxin system RelE/ParE family toxin [Nonomuraea montanisoli]